MSAPVASFKAQLVALGDAGSINPSEHDHEDMALLLFVAPIDEVRKAAPLFRATVDLHAGPAHEVAPVMLAALKGVRGELASEDCNWCGARNEKCSCKDGQWFRDVVAAIAKAEGRT